MTDKEAIAFLSTKAALTRGINKHYYRRLYSIVCRYEEALRFYAESNWDSGCGCCQYNFDPKTNPVSDNGETARKALEVGG